MLDVPGNSLLRTTQFYVNLQWCWPKNTNPLQNNIYDITISSQWIKLTLLVLIDAFNITLRNGTSSTECLQRVSFKYSFFLSSSTKTLINFNYKYSQPKYINSKLEGNLTGEKKNKIA